MAIPAEDILRALSPEERAAIEKRSAELLAEFPNRPSADLVLAFREGAEQIRSRLSPHQKLTGLSLPVTAQKRFQATRLLSSVLVMKRIAAQFRSAIECPEMQQHGVIRRAILTPAEGLSASKIDPPC